MSKYRTLNPGDRFPADYADALGEFLGTAVENFQLRIKPTDQTVLQVPAGADNDQVAAAVDGRWRYIAATIERASPGGVARTLDVYITASDNVFVAGGGGETDDTDYSFALAIVEVGATPGAVALYRKVGSAPWDGAKFTAVDPIVGPQAGTARHATTHGAGGSDPITPAAIGAATAAALATETARAEAAEGGIAPVGAIIPYVGAGDPPEGQWIIADGRLIDRTTFAAFFARAGHAYNLGVDPGANKVKIPDKRGRKSIGAINMGSVAGAGPNDNAHAQAALGAKGGEVNHTSAVSEMPSHDHFGATGAGSSPQHVVANPGGTSGVSGIAAADQGPIGIPPLSISPQGGGGPHNNLDPYEADSYLVRVA